MNQLTDRCTTNKARTTVKICCGRCEAPQTYRVLTNCQCENIAPEVAKAGQVVGDIFAECKRKGVRGMVREDLAEKAKAQGVSRLGFRAAMENLDSSPRPTGKMPPTW